MRDDGLHGNAAWGNYGENDGPYNSYLKAKGYDTDNPWAIYANGSVENGRLASGWFVKMPTSRPTSAKRTAKRPG